MLENVENMTVNDVDLAAEFTGPGDAYFVVNEVRGRGVLPEAVDLVHVQGMDGAHLSGKTTPERVIEIDITLKGESVEDLRERIERLNSVLHSEKEVAISFADEPERTYFGTLADVSYRAEISHIYQATLVIICPDPFKYGPELTVDFPSDTVIVENPGTADADPIFELTANERSTFAMVSNGEEYMLIGTPIDPDEMEPVERLTNIFEHDFGNFIGWSDVITGHTWNDSLLGGVVGGEFAIGTNQWYATDWGSDTGGWHGPSKRTVFSESIQDFQVDHSISSLSYTGQLGKNALFLLDENDNIVASLGVVDRTVSKWNNHVVFTLGGHKQIFEFQGFNNANMWLRLIREGTKFTAMAYMIRDDGTMYNKVTRYFDDNLGEFQTPISQAAVYVARYQDYTVHPMYVNHIRVNRLNDVDAEQIPYIIEPGDIVTFNHVTRNCYINGEPVDFDFGAEFFKLKRGDNTLVVQPDNTFDAAVKFRPPYR